ncbi:uncharacterized protein LOC126902440 [Daktulosphaira vitifoliae]|uniref:uncharacterized protein LOC126902440 n=1 Tax=Daktulosphaira vitifoliae TaxID=58002 RepID=UPI0021AA19D2|nr:uncharacterized protein LOC126902440 [Daktulosphaira vitifoliae]
MKFYPFTLISIVIFILKPDEGIYCKTYYVEYKHYIKMVVNHIYSRIELYKKQDSNNTIDIITNLQLKKKLLKFSVKYNYTINVLNYKYNEIVQKFLAFVNVILSKCQKYHKNKSTKHFIPYVVLLQEVVKSSKTLFENLYNAMKFISYIDIRFLFFGSVVPHGIIDEIEFIYQYVLEKSENTRPLDLNKSPYEVCEMNFENLKKFHFEASTRVENFFRNSNALNSFILYDLKKIQTTEIPTDTRNLRKSTLQKFFNDITEIWYKNLGFEQFLNPIITEFIPPIDPDTNQKYGIEALDIICKEPGWKSMEHISINYCEKQINVNRIIEDPINNLNFRIKKEHVTQLLRCRFTEMMNIYRTLLSAMLTVCQKVAFYCYYNCLVKIFNSFKESKIMLDGFRKALTTLNRSSIWSVNFKSNSSLQNIFKWVTGFLNLLGNNDFCQDSSIIIFDNKTMKIVDNLLTNFQIYFNSFSEHLRYDMNKTNTRCYISKPFKNDEAYIEEFKDSANVLNSPNSEWVQKIILHACNYFDNFCKNVHKSCYEDLGFEKLTHCQNKELDSKLNYFTVDLST